MERADKGKRGMERETVKKILLYCRDIDGEIALNNRMIRDYEDRYLLIGGTISQIIKSSPANLTETAALNVPDYVSGEFHYLTTRNEQLNNLKKAILKEVDKLPYYQRSALYYFYIKALHWVQISERIHYSTTQCKNIRNRALDELGALFGKNELIIKFNYPD